MTVNTTAAKQSVKIRFIRGSEANPCKTPLGSKFWGTDETRMVRIYTDQLLLRCCRDAYASQTDQTIAVGELVEFDADLVEQGEVKVGEGFDLVVAHVAVAFDACCLTTGEEDRQIGVIV